MHDSSVTIPGCYKDVYVNSFFLCTARLWNSLPIECFPLTYDLSGFKSRINCRFFLNRFPVCFNLFVLLFLVSPCLVVAVQPCIVWIPIKKKILSIYKNSNCSFLSDQLGQSLIAFNNGSFFKHSYFDSRFFKLTCYQPYNVK